MRKRPLTPEQHAAYIEQYVRDTLDAVEFIESLGNGHLETGTRQRRVRRKRPPKIVNPDQMEL